MQLARSLIMQPPYLAQADNADAVFWTFILLLLVFALAGVVWWVRRKLAPDEDFHGEGFTLGDLRALHKAGKMTDFEYERAKEVILAGLGVPPAKPDEPLVKPQTPPGRH